ncbi:MAG TPA: DUF5056 domain-containing protein [Paludibacter sp.]
METTKTDKMLKDFFSERKQEIADNGFTQRVIRKLPEQTDRGWIVWIFTAIGMAISIYLGINSGLIQNILMYMEHISIYYLLAGIFCFPLVGSIGMYFAHNRNF